MDEAGTIAARLTAAFRAIADTRMKDVPILNPALAVDCVGPVAWQGDWLAVVVTPWFMNLMLLPQTPGAWHHAQGSTVERMLPSGSYAFVAGEDEQLGPSLSCSLFSPMFDFTSQDEAMALARDILAAAMAGDETEAPPPPAAAPEKPSRRALFGLGRKAAGETA